MGGIIRRIAIKSRETQETDFFYHGDMDTENHEELKTTRTFCASVVNDSRQCEVEGVGLARNQVKA